MRHDRNPNRWWSVAPDLTPGELVLILALCALVLLSSGCGTMPSPSASPRLYAPAEITAPVPPPVYLPAGELAPEDLLDNLAINGEIANDLRSRLLAIQRWAKSIGAMR